MNLWADLISPAELTGYAREHQRNIEESKGSLAAFIPNREVGDIVATFFQGESGLQPEANFRAYDAAPEVAGGKGGRRVTLSLPALGQTVPVSEYVQLRSRNATDAEVRDKVLETVELVVEAVSDRIERQRGIVLATGKSTIDQHNYVAEDDFGRAPELTTTAPQLWSDPEVSRLDYLETLADLYEEHNDERPGTLLVSRRIANALRKGKEFETVGRRTTSADVNDILTDSGLPTVTVFERKTFSGRVLPDDVALLLPAPVAPDAWNQTKLGATFWGRTLTSQDASYQIQASDQPGIVAGVYRNPTPPMIAEVTSDAIGLPVLANANLSLAAKVL